MIVRALVAGMLLLPLAAPAQPPARDNPPPTGTAIVRGRVVVAGTEHGLAKVTVRAVSPPLRVNKAVLTDASGRYEIAELPAGRYSITTTKTNYVPAVHGQLRPLGPGKPIDVANGTVVDHVDFALQRAGAIAGKIVDEFGDPAAGVQVVPMRYMFFNGERRLQSAGPWSITNDLGEYRLFGLFPGQYYVSATLRSNNLGSESTEATAYAPTFFPGTGSPADAQKLIVAAGQTFSGIDIALIPVIAARISGTALDALGRPLDKATVDLMPRVAFAPSPGGNAPTRPDGTFVISGVPPGEYTLRASRPGQQEDEYALADVTVAGGDVSGLQLVATKPTPIRGRIVFEPGKGKPPVGPAVRVTAVRPIPMVGVPGTTTGREDGTFELKTASGHAYIRAAVLGTGDWRLSHVLVNGIDIIDTGLDIPAGSSVDNVLVELTSRHTEISGSVVDAAGDHVRDCVVILFARDPQRWTGPTRYVVATRPDSESVFHARLPAGDYFAAAFEHPEQVPTDPEVLAQLRDRAIPFSIADGETKKVELKLSQAPVY